MTPDEMAAKLTTDIANVIYAAIAQERREIEALRAEVIEFGEIRNKLCDRVVELEALLIDMPIAYAEAETLRARVAELAGALERIRVVTHQDSPIGPEDRFVLGVHEIARTALERKL